MTAQRRPLDDRLIEAAIARRAPGHADAALLAEIMAAAGASRRVRGWPALPRLSRPAWVALAAVLLVAAALVATLVGSQPPLPPIPRASASPGLPSQPVTVVVPSANPTPTATAGALCIPDDAVVTGAALPPTTTEPVSIAADRIANGAYTTSDDRQGGPASDIWSLRSGVSTRVAAISDPATYHASIGDVTADGRKIALIVSTGTGDRHCSDVLILDTDDLTVTRIKPAIGGPRITRAVFIAAGRSLALETADPSGDIIVPVDLEDGSTHVPLGCTNASRTGVLAVAPGNGRLAVACSSSSTVQLWDPATATWSPVAIDFPYLKYVEVAWAGPTTVLAATETTSNKRPFEWRTVDVPSLPVPPDAAFADPVSTTIPGSDIWVSPDGRSIITWTNTGLPDCCDDLYVLDTATGHASRFARAVVRAGAGVSWSSDSGSVLYGTAAGPVGTPAHLVIADLATGTKQRFEMPASFSGVFHLP